MAINSKKIFGISLKNDVDAIALGAVAMFGAMCVPKLGDMIANGAAKVKSLIGRVF